MGVRAKTSRRVGWSGWLAEATPLDTMAQMNQASCNIVNMLHGAWAVRDANNYEQQEQALPADPQQLTPAAAAQYLQAKENRFDDHQLSVR